MSSIIGRSAFRASGRLLQQSEAAINAGERQKDKAALKTGAKRDPELLILLGVMTGAAGLVGWHFSRSPTSATSEASIAKAKDSEPWKETGGATAYQYHPGGDRNAPKKDAPSPLNSVIIPNVNLPKELHDTFNKWGKDDY